MLAGGCVVGILESEECLSLPHPLPFLQEPSQPRPPSKMGRGGAPRTSSSLFKVLDAKAEVMPAFLDCTRDWNREVTKGVRGIDWHPGGCHREQNPQPWFGAASHGFKPQPQIGNRSQQREQNQKRIGR